MSKVLVTGSSGLVGSATVSLFREKGDEVIGIDNNMRAHFFGTEEQKTEHNIDIRDQFAVESIFQKHTFDVIIHAAAQPSHDYSKDHVLEDFDTNARATVILLEATRKYCPNATFIYVSTDKVYGERMSCDLIEDKTRMSPLIDFENRVPFKETLGLDFAGNRSPFGCSKAAADMYVQEYGNYFGMKTACFRCGCITGKNHEGAELHGFLAYLAKCIKEGKTYKIFGHKGKQVRDQIHADDLANAFWHFAQNPKVAAAYNMGGGPERSISILEAIVAIEKETGNQTGKFEEKYEFAEARKGDRVWDVHDVSKFRAQYPEWDYKYSLHDIIRDVCSK